MHQRPAQAGANVNDDAVCSQGAALRQAGQHLIHASLLDGSIQTLHALPAAQPVLRDRGGWPAAAVGGLPARAALRRTCRHGMAADAGCTQRFRTHLDGLHDGVEGLELGLCFRRVLDLDRLGRRRLTGRRCHRHGWLPGVAARCCGTSVGRPGSQWGPSGACTLKLCRGPTGCLRPGTCAAANGSTQVVDAIRE